MKKDVARAFREKIKRKVIEAIDNAETRAQSDAKNGAEFEIYFFLNLEPKVNDLIDCELSKHGLHKYHEIRKFFHANGGGRILK